MIIFKSVRLWSERLWALVFPFAQSTLQISLLLSAAIRLNCTSLHLSKGERENNWTMLPDDY